MTSAMTAKDWDKVLANMKSAVTEQVFETWLRPLRFVAQEGSVLFIATPHKFFKQWIEDNHIDQIEEAARKELGEEISIDIVVGGRRSRSRRRPPRRSSSSRPPRRRRSAAAAPPWCSTRGTPSTGSSSAPGTSSPTPPASPVANGPGASYNPLFIYGGVGLGKTHLLHAIGNEVLVRHPRLRVCYIPAEKFTNELISLHPDEPDARSSRSGTGTPTSSWWTTSSSSPGKDAHAGRVLPHLQRPVFLPQADRGHQRQVPQGDPGSRGADPVAGSNGVSSRTSRRPTSRRGWRS